jgi:hypothetical protein
MWNLAYELLLIVHSFTRWWVLGWSTLTLLYALFRATSRRAWNASDRGAWSARDQRVARVFIASVDLQVLLGLSLYLAVSPLARAARASWAARGFGALWADPVLRFFGIIHPTLALLAACVAHASWVAVRRTEDARQRQRRLALGATLALAFFLAAVPWPFLGHERPWFRL